MTDNLMKLRARQAAADYMGGAKLRRDSEQLADKSLKDKFACSEWTINRVRHGMPTSVLDEEDQVLVRKLIAEKVETDKKLPRLTKEYLGYKYQVSREAIDMELDLAGFVNPKAKRKKKVAAA